ncbi:hypothetical protein JCM19240_5434 [Vibrio maritimus]|uniref:Uncharacterized protein n=1 Tax=Vibrio maritimus TaxID=990268 RepID=A0A090SYN1_9VIBR|nr:hypothetical protein JCM19240_5434 [Vibrio maritimus]
MKSILDGDLITVDTNIGNVTVDCKASIESSVSFANKMAAHRWQVVAWVDM